MSQQVSATAGALSGSIAKAWGWVLTLGILTLLLGVVVLAWPGATILAVAVLFGVQLLVLGVLRFAVALVDDDAGGGRRVLNAVLGVLAFVAGLIALRAPIETAAILALVLGIFWIVEGAAEVFTAAVSKGMPGRALTVLAGVLGIVAGTVVLVYPEISLLVLAVVLGIWLLVYGILQIVLSLQLRSALRSLRAAA